MCVCEGLRSERPHTRARGAATHRHVERHVLHPMHNLENNVNQYNIRRASPENSEFTISLLDAPAHETPVSAQ